MISKSQLQKISSRLRKGVRSHEDLEKIEAYRDSMLPHLAEVLRTSNAQLGSKDTPFLISGRPKRLKSIIRKIERMPGASISTLADIVGVRIITLGLDDQEEIFQNLKKIFKIRTVKDYREEPNNNYHAVHLYVEIENILVEVQIRTIPQQLWAVESEFLGERVKEGAGSSDQVEYLEELSLQCYNLDRQKSYLDNKSAIGLKRNAICHTYPKLLHSWESSVGKSGDFCNYLLVYDNYTRELLSLDAYSFGDQEEEISSEFCRKTRILRKDRYDVLWLNSISKEALQVTHPIFFPS
ncbi:hypothetical protein EOL70_15045 [Leucothrix sargassi]|nr:hypothetical protein EOL70_15045 [Leucothrix sargassi]